MSISEHDHKNFQTLLNASHNNDLCIVECKDKDTGLPVIAVCAAINKGDMIEFVPLARMFEKNPYEFLLPPDVPHNSLFIPPDIDRIKDE
jgi:hypothetical protein